MAIDQRTDVANAAFKGECRTGGCEFTKECVGVPAEYCTDIDGCVMQAETKRGRCFAAGPVGYQCRWGWGRILFSRHSWRTGDTPARDMCCERAAYSSKPIDGIGVAAGSNGRGSILWCEAHKAVLQVRALRELLRKVGRDGDEENLLASEATGDGAGHVGQLENLGELLGVSYSVGS